MTLRRLPVTYRGEVIGYAETLQKVATIALAHGARVDPQNPHRAAHWIIQGRNILAWRLVSEMTEIIPKTISQTIRSIRAELVERFPKAFCPKGAQKVPLKIGINRDIKAAWPEVSSKHLRMAMFDYTRGFKYVANMKAGAERIDLDGQPAGAVSDDDAADAAEKLVKLQERAKTFRRRRIEDDHLASLQSAAE